MIRRGSVRRLFPRTRMGVFTAIVVGLWLLKTLLLTPSARGSLSSGQQFSLDLLTLLLAVPAVYYSWRVLAAVRRKLVWKIRRRLILAHIFMGAIPILFIVVIVYVSALLFYYQLSYYLISNQIGIQSAQAHALAVSVRAELEQSGFDLGSEPRRIQDFADRNANFVLSIYPSASVIVRVQNDDAGQGFVAGNRNVKREALPGYRIPAWIGQQDFSGLVIDEGNSEVYRGTGERQGHVFLRSLVFGEARSGIPISVEVSVPFDQYVLDRLKAALGIDLLLAQHVPVSGLNVFLQNTGLLQKDVLCATFDLEQSGDTLGRPVWSILLFPVSWSTGEETGSSSSEVLFVELSTSRLFGNLFRSESNVSRTILGVLKIVVVIFLVVELLSMVVGVMLTKSITTAVFNLDRGTGFIRRGDFSHRIVVRSEDQLGALAKSFNQMTEYIQTLVKERVEKERLERELEIAKEVQEQLFPKRAPQLKRMEFTGLCLPARVVSGDYYDFLSFSPDQIGMALGDICGKGISAALLMANLQATLRSNVINLMRNQGAGERQADRQPSVARVVKLLNDHIYSYTSANKFASMFYAVYEDPECRLTFCNAGHNPPLYFTNGECRRLLTGGTVVGIFPDAEYDQETLSLRAGDVFLAYTDGIVESVNEYGEEFGEQRLVEIVQSNSARSAEEIQQAVVDEVLRWAFEEERDDDMTLIVAKVR